MDRIDDISSGFDDHLMSLLKAYDSELCRRIASKVKYPDAEDVRQEVFLKAYTGLKRMSEEELQSLALRDWLYQVVEDVVRDHYRKRRRNSSTISIYRVDTDEQDIEDKTCDRPDEQLELDEDQAERRQVLRKLLQQLPLKYKGPLVLRKLEEKRYDEVARIVGQPVEIVHSLVENAMRRLRRAAHSQHLK